MFLWVCISFKEVIKGAYWIIQRFLVHYQILHLSNIAIAILDFSLVLPIKLSLLLALKGDSEEER